ncbi:hypothetical protein PLESTB_001540100 [Pleodorina starrii]|uniref:Uncharacterized protein n=1 Tax=Pleodorina starrii TaxID=330485 RepID=A0A9W6BX40_9CHLO|nr:hypothetical protein PLESTB_001540100 [Pleodorina starrii]GLC67290.1 hypothetical protein PLESTF_000538900 [Pleodorina starrii]
MDNVSSLQRVPDDVQSGLALDPQLLSAPSSNAPETDAAARIPNQAVQSAVPVASGVGRALGPWPWWPHEDPAVLYKRTGTGPTTSRPRTPAARAPRAALGGRDPGAGFVGGPRSGTLQTDASCPQRGDTQRTRQAARPQPAGALPAAPDIPAERLQPAGERSAAPPDSPTQRLQPATVSVELSPLPSLPDAPTESTDAPLSTPPSAGTCPARPLRLGSGGGDGDGGDAACTSGGSQQQQQQGNMSLPRLPWAESRSSSGSGAAPGAPSPSRTRTDRGGGGAAADAPAEAGGARRRGANLPSFALPGSVRSRRSSACASTRLDRNSSIGSAAAADVPAAGGGGGGHRRNSYLAGLTLPGKVLSRGGAGALRPPSSSQRPRTASGSSTDVAAGGAASGLRTASTSTRWPRDRLRKRATIKQTPQVAPSQRPRRAFDIAAAALTDMDPATVTAAAALRYGLGDAAAFPLSALPPHAPAVAAADTRPYSPPPHGYTLRAWRRKLAALVRRWDRAASASASSSVSTPRGHRLAGGGGGAAAAAAAGDDEDDAATPAPPAQRPLLVVDSHRLTRKRVRQGHSPRRFGFLWTSTMRSWKSKLARVGAGTAAAGGGGGGGVATVTRGSAEGAELLPYLAEARAAEASWGSVSLPPPQLPPTPPPSPQTSTTMAAASTPQKCKPRRGASLLALLGLRSPVAGPEDSDGRSPNRKWSPSRQRRHASSSSSSSSNATRVSSEEDLVRIH